MKAAENEGRFDYDPSTGGEASSSGASAAVTTQSAGVVGLFFIATCWSWFNTIQTLFSNHPRRTDPPWCQQRLPPCQRNPRRPRPPQPPPRSSARARSRTLSRRSRRSTWTITLTLRWVVWGIFLCKRFSFNSCFETFQDVNIDDELSDWGGSALPQNGNPPLFSSR